MNTSNTWSCYACLCRAEGDAPGMIPPDMVGYREPDDPDARCMSCDDRPSDRERHMAEARQQTRLLQQIAKAQEGESLGASLLRGDDLPVVPVSPSRAAKLLGVSKSRTLAPAIASGAIRTIQQGKRRMVPPEEMRRLASEGIRAPARQSRRRKAPSPPAPLDVSSEAACVLALQQR